MDKLDLIIKALDDNKLDTNGRIERLEAVVKEGFLQINGRVRRNENDVLRIKTLWSAAVVVGGFLFHYLYDLMTKVAH